MFEAMFEGATQFQYPRLVPDNRGVLRVIIFLNGLDRDLRFITWQMLAATICLN